MFIIIKLFQFANKLIIKSSAILNKISIDFGQKLVFFYSAKTLHNFAVY